MFLIFMTFLHNIKSRLDVNFVSVSMLESLIVSSWNVALSDAAIHDWANTTVPQGRSPRSEWFSRDTADWVFS